jgi:hypothetical protein
VVVVVSVDFMPCVNSESHIVVLCCDNSH